MDYFIFLQALYFFLPAYGANMAPSLAAKLNILRFLDKRVDANKKFLGKELMGSHKTWRGLLLGTCCGMAIYFLQTKLFSIPFFAEVSVLNYARINPWLYGFLISFGALFGDMLFSFFKRQKGIRPGASWMPFDQTDYVFGVMLFITPFQALSWKIWMWLLLLTFILHIVFNRVGYYLKINKSEW